MPGLPLTLVYDAPVECPAQAALQSAVENLVAGERARPFSARVTIRKVGDSYQASIASDGGSARVLSGSTCAEVVEGTSVVLALAITPKAAVGDEPRSPGEALPEARPRTPRAIPATHWVFGAAARGDVGTLPHATLGFGGQLGFERGRWSALAAGTYWLPAHGTLSTRPELGGDFSWWTGALMACGAPETGAVRLDACAGAELGRLSALGAGAGLSSAGPRGTAWGAFAASAAASWAISGGFRLRGSLGLALPFLGRRAFTIDADQVHQPGRVAARAELGPELVF